MDMTLYLRRASHPNLISVHLIFKCFKKADIEGCIVLVYLHALVFISFIMD